MIDLADAQMYKQKVGEWADDAFDVTKKGKQTSAQSAEHQAYLSAYDKFKTAIEDVGPPGIKEQNKELSTLLSLRKDLRNRTAVQERNNFLPLDEIVTATGAALSGLHGNPLPAMLYGANVATKSPGVARGVYKLGEMLSPAEKAAPTLEAGAPGTTAWDAKTELPANAATPAYFRQGVKPEILPLGQGYANERAARMGATPVKNSSASLADALKRRLGNEGAVGTNISPENFSISPTSNGKFVAYDPIRQERIYSKGITAKQFDTEEEARQAIYDILKKKHGIDLQSGSSAIPMLGLTAGVSGAGLSAALIAKRKLEQGRNK